MRKFSPAEDQFIRDNYLKVPAKRMAKMLGRSEGTARQRMKLLGIVVPPEIVEKFKIESRYKKGSISQNKGKKWTEYMSEEGMRNSRKTQFKKGQAPHNTKQDFEISIRPDNRGIEYKFIRIGLGKWIPLLRYNWEAVNGPILKGFCLIHKDGDPMNCEASNGLLLSNAELMKKNTLHNYPKDIANTIQLLGALSRRINKRKKEKK